MKVLYDYQVFSQRIGGISRCFCELARHLPLEIAYEFAVCETDNVYLKELLPYLPSCKLKTDSFLYPLKFKGRLKLFALLEKHCSTFPSFSNVNKRYSLKKLQEGKFDIFHATLYDDYFIPYLNHKPFVITVHDMIWELYPDKKNAPLSRQKHNLCQKANHIITVSQHSKKDLLRLWDIPEEKVSVIYHGSSKSKNKYEKRLVDHPYFLFVGRRSRYKNFSQTIKDFSLFHSMHPEVWLICTGDTFKKEEKKLLAKYDLEECVYSIFASDKELENLYHYALAFVFPSIYEGFGLPILEAFSHGCPVLLNNKSCFPEIASDAAIYFDSNEFGESNLTDKLCLIYDMNERERKTYITKGYERLDSFSWKKSARELSIIYANLIHS